jgi:predicted permease
MNNLRYAVRQLLKNSGFASITVLVLALGISGTIVIFTVFNALYLRPFPFGEQGRMVDLDETAPKWDLEYTGLAYADFYGWREQNRSFECLGAWASESRNVSVQGNAERTRGVRVTHDLATVLGIQPVFGRLFTAEDDRPGAAKVILLGNGFWKRQFGGSQDVIGRSLRLDHEPFTIIGVLPPDEGVMVEGEFWVPLAMDPSAQGSWFLSGIGRLKEGLTIAAALDDLRRVHQGLVESHRANENTSPRLTPVGDRLFGKAKQVIQMLLGAVGVVMLIACGNVASLMLARGLTRLRELGVRISLGATPWRIARLIGGESLLLAVLGGLLGMYLGYWGLQMLLASLPQRPPRWITFEVDWRVWLFAGLLVVSSAVLGAVPALRSALRMDLREILQSSTQQSTASGGGRRSLHALVVAEVALTLVLMVQAALLLKTFRSLQQVDPGYRPDHVLVYEIALPPLRYESSQARMEFFRSHLERVRGLPAVASASAVTAPPLSGHWGNFFTIENAPPKGPNEQDPVVLQRIAFPGYFETMGIRIVAGRDFTAQDGIQEGSPSVIVNESFARRFWPSQDAVGKRISHRYPNAPWMTVIGVARDVKHYGMDQPMTPGLYIPYTQESPTQMAVVVRSRMAPSSLVPSVRALVRESDPDLAVFDVVTMEERLAQSMWVRRLSATLFGIFSGVALALAVGGIYGVFSYAVNRRTQEIGVRLALGARRRDVLWMVVRQGLGLAAAGTAIGLIGSLGVAPLMRRLLFGVSPVDPYTFAGIALLLAVVALLACWLPARRAAGVEPMSALRYG